MVDKEAQDRRRGRHHLGRLDQYAAVDCESTMPGQATEQHAEIDALRHRLAGPDPDRGEADVVGVFEHADPPAAIEGDVEFARQAVQLAVVQDVMVEGAGQRPGVDQLLRVDAGERTAGQVADVVGASAARGQAELVDGGQDIERVGRADLADLQIGAGGDVEIAAAEPLGDVGEPRGLRCRQDAARQAQPQHERVLVRRDVEQPVEFVQEDVGAFREPSGRRVGRHLVPHVERVLRPLRQFLRHQRAAGRNRPVLREAMNDSRVVDGWRISGLGNRLSGGLRCRVIGQRDAAFFGNPGDKSFEILLLVFGKAWISRHLT